MDTSFQKKLNNLDKIFSCSVPIQLELSVLYACIKSSLSVVHSIWYIIYKLNTCTGTKLKDCAWIVIFDQICEQSVLNASSNHNSMCIYIKPSLQMALFYFHCFGLQHGSKHLAWTFSFNPIKSIYSFNKFFTVSPKKCIITRINTNFIALSKILLSYTRGYQKVLIPWL